MLEGDIFSTFLSIFVLSVQKDEKLLQRREPSFGLFSIIIVTWYVCDHTATATKVSGLLNFV